MLQFDIKKEDVNFLNSNSHTTSDTYRVVITAEFTKTNIAIFELDTCTEKSISARSNIVTQPLQNGLTMSDHMYRLPDEISLSGKFSLNGNRINNLFESNISDSQDRLTRIQETFEYIKNNGILCTLTTMSGLPNGDTRFKVRKNMALENINWRETNINSMSYTFTFKEVIIIDIPEYVSEPYTNFSPQTNEPTINSLGSVLIESGDIAKIVIASLYDNGYIKSDVLRIISYIGTGTLIQGATSAAVAGTIVIIGSLKILSTVIINAAGKIALTKALTTLLPALGVTGLIIGAVVGAIALGFYLYKKGKENEKLKKIFKLVKNADRYINSDGSVNKELAKNAQIDEVEMNKLQSLINKVAAVITNTMNSIKVFQISTNEDDNNDRETTLTIGSNIFYITITRNNTYDSTNPNIGSPFKLTVRDQENNVLTANNKYGQAVNATGWTYISNLLNGDRYSNSLFITFDQEYEVYLYNGQLNDEINNTQEKQNSAKEKLYNYQIVVCKGILKNEMKKLSDIIYKAIQEEGYE